MILDFKLDIRLNPSVEVSRHAIDNDYGVLLVDLPVLVLNKFE